MDQLMQFVIIGLGTGAVYGLSALGLVLIYRGSKVLNFAHGGVALATACAYHEMLKAGWPTTVAVVTALAISAVLGAMIELLIMRRMTNASATSKVVATIALLLVLQSVATLRYNGVTQFVPSLLPTRSVSVLGATVGIDRLCLFGIGTVLAVGLGYIYKRTKFGLCTAAAAESPVGAAALGYSPRRLSLSNWMLGTTLAGLAGILLVPIVGITPISLSQLVFPAMAAALIGGFTRFDVTYAVAVILGLVQALATRYVPATGWSTALPFLVVLALLSVGGRRSLGRHERREVHPRLGPAISTPLTIGVVVAILVALTLGLDVNWVNAITVSEIFAILGLSLVLLTGYSGQVSLAQFAFAGIGALSAAKLSQTAGLPFLVCAVCGMVAAGLAGVCFALPTLRARGAAIAIVTLGLSFAVQAVVFDNSVLNGGLAGLVVEPPSVFGYHIDPVVYPTRYALACLVALVIVAVVVANLRRGTTGRFMVSTRDSLRAASSLGINTTSANLFAFGMSALIAGLGGVLLAFQSPNVFLSGYTFDSSVALLVATLLGGVGYVSGAQVAALGASGGVLWWALQHTGWSQYMPLAIGALTLLQIVALPGGVASANVAFAESVRRRLNLRSHLVPKNRPTRLTVSAWRSSGDHILEVRDLSAVFGGVQALGGVSLAVRSGEVLGVIGPNGAGKTTLIDAVTGVNRRYRGAVMLDGSDLRSRRDWQRARAGIARSFQSLELIEDLTVAENLCVAVEGTRRGNFARDLVRPRAADLGAVASAAVDGFGLADALDMYPRELSYGRRRLVAVARSLAAGPKFLLLDEPAAGLDQRERRELGRLIAKLAGEMGVGVILVEHDVGLVLSVCDRIVVLDQGKPLASGTPDLIRNDERVVRAFLGAPTSELRSSQTARRESRDAGAAGAEMTAATGGGHGK